MRDSAKGGFELKSLSSCIVPSSSPSRYNSNELYLLRDYNPEEGARRLAAFPGPANPSLRIRIIDFDGTAFLHSFLPLSKTAFN